MGSAEAVEVPLDINDNNREAFVEVVDETAEICVAAPGPLPKAGTDPTCFDADDGGAETVCLFCDRLSVVVGRACAVASAVVEDTETVVTAPGPSPKAGTDPTCFEAVEEVAAPLLCC